MIKDAAEDIFSNQKAWVITVDMGYGHQRTADNLKHLSPGEKIICANNYNGMPLKDRKLWENSRKFYEAVSAFKRVPLIGGLVFAIFDFFQRVPQFYPKRDLSKPDFTLKQLYSLIGKGWGKDLILRLSSGQVEKHLPLICTFFTPAFMAEFFKYPGEIFCTVCDTDMSRTWVPLDPRKSKIKYFAPTKRVAERLKLYGVKPENILFTGYPLPLENIEALKEDLKNRLLNLDPRKRFFDKYDSLLTEKLGSFPDQADHPLTLMFAVGGAGAQKEMAIAVLESLKFRVKAGEIKMILVAGIRKAVKEYFEQEIKDLGLSDQIGGSLEILSAPNMKEYFQAFNQSLRKTDILWTKPSELSFYAALGLPIIIAPTIGSHEEFNKRWLLKSDFGVLQKNPSFAAEWITDMINEGHLAERAFSGFIDGESQATINIQKAVEK
ncbi:hypothetical protein L6250_02020 [Candidatus Parcubacteria bacterium]|nr:hypothetical protein [Patescibacteria group bacterium]MBU4467052.1 hypothetical protein [Patescibacteria group bacterium]MCG2688392.1 hypothetical protein [Candidatus Parcubacteria bacterium]